MRPCPNLHPLISKKIGIRMMYAPPLRPALHAFRPIRPLVVRCTPRFAGVMLYCAGKRRDLRRRVIIDIVQTLSGLALIFPSSWLVGKLIDDPRWCLISILPQVCILVGLAHTKFYLSFCTKFANWRLRRFPHA